MADGALPEELAAANRYRPTLAMTGRVALKKESKWVSSKAAVLVRRPDSLRVTLLDPAGMAWFVGTVNPRLVSYVAPSENLEKQLPAGKGAMLRIGRLKIPASDLVRFIHPGMEPAWLENSQIVRTKNGVRIKKKTAVFRLELDARGRVKSLLSQRSGGGVVRFKYRYPADSEPAMTKMSPGREGGYSVEINGNIRFEFDRVVTDRPLPESLFDPPALR